MSESVGYGPPLPLTGGTITGNVVISGTLGAGVTSVTSLVSSGTITSTSTISAGAIISTGSITTTSSMAAVGANFTGAVNVGSTSDVTLTGGNGQIWTYGTVTELTTVSTSATTDTTANLLPATSVIEAVTVRVITAIPTAATFSLGDATVAGRFVTGVAVAQNTTAVGTVQFDSTGTAGPRQTAAAKLRITPSSTPATPTGQLRITVYYKSFTPPTS